MKTKYKISLLSCLCVVFVILFILLTAILVKNNETTALTWEIGLVTVAMILVFASLAITLVWITKIFARSRNIVKNSFDSFTEDIMSSNNIGFVIYNAEHKIIWASNFIKNKFHKDFIDIHIKIFFTTISDNKEFLELDMNQTKIEFENNKNIYEAQFWPLSNIIIIRDITTETLFKNEVHDQKTVIGEIEIDNYQMYQSILSEEQLYLVNKTIIDTFNEYSKEYNLIYRQYTNGKFIVITDQVSLYNMSKDKFSLFTNIQKNVPDTSIGKLSLSVGFARGWSSLKEKLEQAKKALVQAQNRGGDQVAIFSDTETAIYYGSSIEIVSNNNMTKIKKISDEFLKKLDSDQITKVIVYGHKSADMDSLGSSYGIAYLAHQRGKKAYICAESFDMTTTYFRNELSYKNNVYEDTDLNLEKIIISANKASKLTDLNTLVVFVDNSDPGRTDNKDAILNADRENIFVFDHHRVGKQIDYCPVTNIYVETTASSASEIVTEIFMLTDREWKFSPLCAQLLLGGILVDTVQFTKSVSARTFQASAWLQSKGANVVEGSEILKIDETTKEQINTILENAQEVKKGYYLAYSPIEVEADVISMAANELLKTKGRVASFVIARLKGTNLYKLSARGINTNVQIITEQVGGGGHFGTAAAISNEELETFVNNVHHAITTTERELKDESYTN
ncbi:DHH family phosphoesterase [Mycoplasma sp. 4404]|uniref:DHH family phosphoesterase n=1 Tax=Mycoplasma sp. 4404 TaxID=3108530 RepID=UPI002B1D90AA|nr:DHH family phosphoesterase [Mycoplasma sp. 4404]MEA4162381.1 DHH family phosphoesterase [Mycoplasma sp. 4404]